MRKLLTVLAVLVLGAYVALPAGAQATDVTGTTDMSGCSTMDMSGGTMDMTTIQSLRDCVVHGYAMGYITNQGVEASLLKLVDAAQAAVDNGNTAAAIKSLNAFILLVQKQPGTIIDPPYSSCLVMHAQTVIQALQG